MAATGFHPGRHSESDRICTYARRIHFLYASACFAADVTEHLVSYPCDRGVSRERHFCRRFWCEPSLSPEGKAIKAKESLFLLAPAAVAGNIGRSKLQIVVVGVFVIDGRVIDRGGVGRVCVGAILDLGAAVDLIGSHMDSVRTIITLPQRGVAR